MEFIWAKERLLGSAHILTKSYVTGCTELHATKIKVRFKVPHVITEVKEWLASYAGRPLSESLSLTGYLILSAWCRIFANLTK